MRGCKADCALLAQAAPAASSFGSFGASPAFGQSPVSSVCVFIHFAHRGLLSSIGIC